MPVGHIETAPRGERDPKARFVALRVDELSAAEGPANERKVLVLKDTESAMVEQETVEATSKGIEPAVQAPAAQDTDAIAALSLQVKALTDQLAAIEEEILPAEKDEIAVEASVSEGVLPETEQKVAEIHLVKKSAEGKAPVVAVMKSTDGLQPDFLQRVTAAMAPLMKSIDSVSIRLCWEEEDIVNISFSGEPMTEMTMMDTAKDTAGQATTEQTVLADVAKDVKNLVEGMKVLSARVETIEKARGVTRAVVKETDGTPAAQASSESIFKGAI